MGGFKTNKKADFLEVFRKCLGNISVACKQFGIERQTFYNWQREDEDFARACEEVKEVRKDFIESALDKRIMAGDTAAIIFAAKTQCRDRGYVETIDTNVSSNQPLSIVFNEVKPKELTAGQDAD